jgi:hypothetical protein
MSSEQGFDVLRVLVPTKTSVQGYVIHIIQELSQVDPRSNNLDRQNKDCRSSVDQLGSTSKIFTEPKGTKGRTSHPASKRCGRRQQ